MSAQRQELEVYDSPSNDGKDYILQIKIKNGPLLRAMRMRGYANANQFCSKTGMNKSLVGKFLSLTYAPISPVSGTWRRAVLDLAKHLQLPPESLFPEQHLDQALAKASGEIEVSQSEISALIEHNDPNAANDREQLCSIVQDAMNELSPREERVLRLRFGFNGDEPKTLDDVANDLGISRERVRQIEIRAYRGMKSHRRAKELANAGYAPASDYLFEKQRSARDDASVLKFRSDRDAILRAARAIKFGRSAEDIAAENGIKASVMSYTVQVFMTEIFVPSDDDGTMLRYAISLPLSTLVNLALELVD